MVGFRCPRCQKSFDVQQPGVLPFCSARCKLADLNGWLSEEHSLPMDMEVDPDEEAAAEEEAWRRQSLDEDSEQIA